MLLLGLAVILVGAVLVVGGLFTAEVNGGDVEILGIGLSALPRTGRSASAVVIPIVLVLQFISGIFIQFSVLPEWLQNVASIFPLKWLAQGMRSVFLPEAFAADEPGGTWQHGLTLGVTLIWLVVGLILVRVTFRWIRRS